MDNLTAAKWFYWFSNSGGGGNPALAILNDGNTEAWYDFTDADQLTLSGSNITSALDKSGNSRTLGGFVNQYPTYSSDGALFNGTDQLLKASAFTVNQPMMFYIVFKQITWTSGDKLFDGNTNNNIFLYQSGTSPNIQITAGAYPGNNGNLSLNTFGVLRALISEENSWFQINETSKVSNNMGTKSLDGLTLCRRAAAGADYGHFQIKEFIIRSKADTEADETIIYNYLYNKYMLGGADAAFLAEDGSELQFEDGSTVIPE